MSTEVAEKPVVDTKENGSSKSEEVAKEEATKETPKDAADNVTKVTGDPKTESNQINIDTLDRMPNTGHLVKVNGKILHYERVGTGKIPVLLMPGLMGSSRSDFPEQLGNV